MRVFEGYPILGATLSSSEEGKIARPHEALLSDMDLALRQTFYPLGYAFEILTDEAAVLSAADR